MNGLHPVTLSFYDPETEHAYAAYALPSIVVQGRAAVAIGAIVYFIYGLLDYQFLNGDELAKVWTVRLVAIWAPVLALLLSFHASFRRFHPILLGSVGLVGGLGLIGFLWNVPADMNAYYFPGLILVTVFVYNLVGVRFIVALAINLTLFAVYNVVFGYWHPYATLTLLSNDFFVAAANLIGGAAGYLAEYQRRQLFVRQIELDAERRFHLKRALHDRLTGLPNRELLSDRLNRALAKARRTASLHAGMFIDLDGFKAINDGLGHDRGDLALRKVARRLRKAIREADTVARIGGDEFFVLAQDIGSRENAGQLAEKILSFIETPIAALPGSPALSASIGICLFPDQDEADDVNRIINRADEAMYRAKKAGHGLLAFAEPKVRTTATPDARRPAPPAQTPANPQ
jgi:diguanylate cyclase (GGDEF)-like protein